MSVELYFDMIGRKTAALIAASIEAGALLATEDDAVIARYRGFGWALGIAFQLNDDLLGIWGAEQATGKEPSDVAHASRRCRSSTPTSTPAPATGPAWPRCTPRPRPVAQDVAEVVAILERTGAREYTRDTARRYRDEALAELDAAGVVQPAARERLEQIIVGGHQRLADRRRVDAPRTRRRPTPPGVPVQRVEHVAHELRVRRRHPRSDGRSRVTDRAAAPIRSIDPPRARVLRHRERTISVETAVLEAEAGGPLAAAR